MLGKITGFQDSAHADGVATAFARSLTSLHRRIKLDRLGLTNCLREASLARDRLPKFGEMTQCSTGSAFLSRDGCSWSGS